MWPLAASPPTPTWLQLPPATKVSVTLVGSNEPPPPPPAVKLKVLVDGVLSDPPMPWAVAVSW